MQAVDTATKIVQEGVESLGSVLGAGGIELTPFAAGIVLALGLYMLGAAFPTDGDIWQNALDSVDRAANASLYLLPALSVLMLPSPSYEAYAGSGLLFTLLGFGVAACVPSARNAKGGGSKLQTAALRLANGLKIAGGSFFVGAIAAYAVSYGRGGY